MTWIPFLIVVVAILVTLGLVGVAQIYLELMLDREADSSSQERHSSAGRVRAGGSVLPTRR